MTPEERKYVPYWFVFPLVCIHTIAVCQFQHVQFESLSVRDGLSHTQIRCILEDSRGFIWIGSPEDLNKYDGYSFTIFSHDPNDSTTLSDGDIRAIKEDEHGRLWIATAGGGLNVFDPMKNTIKRYKNDPNNSNSLISNSLHSVFIDQKGNVIAGSTRGISILNPNTNQFEQQIFFNNQKQQIYISAILVDREDKIWMATPLDGLLCFDQKDKSVTYFKIDSLNQRNANISALCQDNQGFLWIGTLDVGLFRFDPRTKNIIQYKHEPGNPNTVCWNVIFSLFEDRSGNLWIGTQNFGLSILDKSRKNFVHFSRDESDPKSLSHNTVLTISEDRNGTIWLGTFGGVNFYHPSLNKFKHYRHSYSRESVSSKIVKGFAEDQNGNVWISTEGGGLNRLEPKTGRFTSFRHNHKIKNSLSTDYTLGLCVDRKGNIWVGTYKGGLNLLRPGNKTFKVYRHNENDPTSISSDVINVIYEDRDGALWIGTRAGLDLFDPKTEKFKRFTSLPSSRYDDTAIIYMLEDSMGRFWVGTISGLYLLDKKTEQFTAVFQEHSEVSEPKIFQVMIEDGQGNIWAGTDQGLYIVNKKDLSVEAYPLMKDVPDIYISGMLEDGKGNFWISTHNGLSRLNPVTKTATHYGMSDGLQDEEFKRLAFLKTKEGTMYFGGVNGFNVFHPDSIRHSAYNFPIYITDFQIFNKSVRIGEQDSLLRRDISFTSDLTLSYEHSVFSIEYAAVNYLTPHYQQYAYMLEGFDDSWTEAGNERKATYTNLDPGNYTFKVKSAPTKGQWSEQIASINITILPPFWGTWWFRAFTGLFVAGSLLAFYKVRVGIVKRQKAVLQQLVEERTKQLARSTEAERQARYQSEQLAQANEELKATLETNKLQTKIIENKNAELDAFFYRISHDLRGPVASLLGLSAVAQMEVKDILALDYIQKQHQQLERLNNIITGLIKLTILDYSTFQKEKIDFNKMIDDCIMSFNGLENFENFTFRKNIQPGVEFYSQWVLLNTILQNLIENAIKYSRQPSPFAQILVRRENGSVVIEVEDNGQGIRAEYQSKIFDMFYRATPHTNGVGLGLYILKKSVDRLNGTIAVRSEFGVGSTFTVRLPAN